MNDLFVRGVTEGREGAEKGLVGGERRDRYHNPLSRQVLDRDFRGSSHCEVLSVVDPKSLGDND
jgi:hypothetical protein